MKTGVAILVVLLIGGAALASSVFAPVALAFFIVALVWPVQQRLQARLPKLAALADKNDAEFFGHLDAEQHAALMQFLQDIVTRHELKGTPVD